jgi:hypothetical protein
MDIFNFYVIFTLDLLRHCMQNSWRYINGTVILLIDDRKKPVTLPHFPRLNRSGKTIPRLFESPLGAVTLLYSVYIHTLSCRYRRKINIFFATSTVHIFSKKFIFKMRKYVCTRKTKFILEIKIRKTQSDKNCLFPFYTLKIKPNRNIHSLKGTVASV